MCQDLWFGDFLVIFKICHASKSIGQYFVVVYNSILDEYALCITEVPKRATVVNVGGECVKDERIGALVILILQNS